MTKRFSTALVVGLALISAACGSGGGKTASPTTRPPASSFSANVTNPWFPLTPGTTFVYSGTKDGKTARDVYTVSHRTQKIDGVPTRLVDDKLYLNGRLEERTTDYYTQDHTGAVWYFGEDTAELDPQGRVTNREGTWHAGVNGATPGIFMTPNPAVGRQYRQEYLKGHAEDHFQVVDLNSNVKVPYRNFTSGVLLTKEWTPLEPDVLDHKYYVKGIGEVREVAVKGPTEELMLVSVKHA